MNANNAHMTPEAKDLLVAVRDEYTPGYTHKQLPVKVRSKYCEWFTGVLLLSTAFRHGVLQGARIGCTSMYVRLLTMT